MAIYMWREYVPYQYEPNANTKVYLPLVENYTNQWNWWTFTTSWYQAPTFWTYQWVECAAFGSNKYLQSSNSQNLWSYYTISAWVYCPSTSNGTIIDGNWIFIIWDSSTIKMSIGRWYWISTSFAKDKWVYVLWLNNYWSYTLSTFIDWVENKVTGSWYTGTSQIFALNSSLDFKWYMSDVIAENKVRTDDFKSEYYNWTKLKYWVS